MTAITDEIRIGVVGLRRGESLLRSSNAVGGGRVTAVFDVDAIRVETQAATIDAIGYADFNEFLAADIDLVVVASPIPFHAEQSIAALDAGKHVLCEVLPFQNFEQAKAIVEASRRGGGRYFVSENCIFYDEIEALKGLHDQGRFGRIYYGEGDYIHDCTGLWFDADGNLTWRGAGHIGVYATHGLGPLLYITGDRISEVRCIAMPGRIVDPSLDLPTMHLLELTTEQGRYFRSRVDPVSHRPHPSTTHFTLQGTSGSYESAVDRTDPGRIWIADLHELSRVDSSASWHPLAEMLPELIGERLGVEAIGGGHGTSEYWLLRSVFDAIRSNIESPIEMHRGMDIGLPSVAALESALLGGAPIAVPDSRSW